MGWRTNLLLLLGALHSAGAASHAEHYDESLTLKPLRDGRVLAGFSFTTLLEGAVPRDPATLGDDDAPQHYTLFPLALGQILRAYAVTELDLTLNAGRWDYGAWGLPPDLGVASGAELRAWMGEGGLQSIDERWQGLRNALSGLFCASLASMDARRTTSPTLTFTPTGALPLFARNGSTPAYALRHATLPSENVCTENLTPLAKLLPCGAADGLAALLAPHRLFDADWHGMGVHVRWLAGTQGGVEVRLAFQAVFNPVRSSPDKRRDWSLGSLFGRSLSRACPVARSSTVTVMNPPQTSSVLSPEPSSRLDDGVEVYDVLTAPKPLDIRLSYPSELNFVYPLDTPAEPLAPLAVSRAITTTSQADGTLHVSVTNNADTETRVLYAETLPWLVTLYLHTLSVTVNGVPVDNAFALQTYTPSANSRPTLLQAELTIPARGTLALRMHVTKTFLRYTEHMPDAQRGWDLPGAVFVPLPSNASSADRGAHAGAAERTYVYSGARLVDVATPDFSMPYNVVMMTCTLFAVLFGNVLKLLTRRWVVVEMGEKGASGGEREGGKVEDGKVDGPQADHVQETAPAANVERT